MKANKLYVLIIGSLLSFSAAKAQEFATDRSIKEQVKQGTVPGTKISNEVVRKKPEVQESSQKISVPVKQQLLNGTYPGLTVTKTAAAKTTPAVVKKEEASLPSANKPVPVKPAQPATSPLMQEEQKAAVAPGQNSATQK